MTDNTIDAVPTLYGGTTFRSRLEAEWAETLSINGIVWQYEPQTLTLPSGTTYIPDFWLPTLGTWIEVKGPGIPRVEKAYELGRDRSCDCSGKCTCRWLGGELVLIGREPLRDDGLRRTRHGYTNWDTAYGPSAYFVTCVGCAQSQWTRISRRLPCRACGFPMHIDDTALLRAADKRLRFAEPTDGWESTDWSDQA